MATFNPSRISLIYQVYFLYIEPIFALGGTYLSIFSPHRFIRGTTPLPLSQTLTSSPITPLTRLLLTNIGSLYFLFAVNEGVVLRLTREKNVWLAVILGMALSDVGHLYAVWEMAPERVLEVGAWSADEWINYGTLAGGFLLRCAFLLGVGR